MLESLIRGCRCGDASGGSSPNGRGFRKVLHAARLVDAKRMEVCEVPMREIFTPQISWSVGVG